MKKNVSLFIFISFILIVSVFNVSAQTVIIKEDFTNTNPNSTIPIPGLATSVTNLPGQTWVKGAGITGQTPFKGATFSGVLSSACDMAENGTVLGISIASNGTYVKPSQIRISADVLIKTTTYANYGVELGFYSVMPVVDSYKKGGDERIHFTGLKLSLDGSLTLYEDVTIKKSIAGPAVTPQVFYKLAYDINTTTGTISNVSMQGSTSTYNFTSTAFTNAATTYAAFLVSGYRGGMDNFIVSDITGLATGISESASNLSVIYPNPAKDKIYFSGNVYKATLFTLQGQQVKSVKQAKLIDVSTVTNGIYILATSDLAGNQKSTKIEIRN